MEPSMTAQQPPRDGSESFSRSDRDRTKRRVRWTLAGGSIAASLGLYVAFALPAASEDTPTTVVSVATADPTAAIESTATATSAAASTVEPTPTTEPTEAEVEATATTVAPTNTPPATRSRAS